MTNPVVLAGCGAFKICRKCGHYKELADFYNNKRTIHGKTATCKDCMKRYAKDNHIQVARAVRSWQDENRPRTREIALIRAKSLRGRYGHTRSQAKIRGIEFSLTFDDYCGLLSSERCHYMNEPLALTGSGLDRKNSHMGYTLENCVPCCLKCNQIRGEDNISYEEMLCVSALLKHLRALPNECHP